ncbi:hypothetical protein DXG01_008001 [Tephrocybe rancida]|nr:hypothetical protein DXG01_008001 [Tephrocybe rancida]
MSSRDSPYSGSRSYKPSAARSARVDHSRQQAEHSRRDPESSTKSKRDTDYLQYYQSSLADGQTDETDRESSSSRLTRQTSGSSTSSSDYSDSQSTELSTTAPLSVPTKVTRRSKAPSAGASDRRRLAIVQMDSLDDSPPRKHKKEDDSESTTIRTRRGVPSNLEGLALVAPPDAAPKTYSHLTPPTTAPTTADTIVRNVSRERAHHHAAPDTTKTSNKHAPDIGAGDQNKAPARDMHSGPRVLIDSNALTPPGNQHIRSSRSPSPGGASDASDQARGLLSPAPNARPAMPRGDTQKSFITTPEIGEKKDIGTRVAAPIVVSLGSAGPFRRKEDSSIRNDSVQFPASALPLSSQDKSPYLHYEPGVHATAGPLPSLPPPRAMFNIDPNSPAPPRPPRLNSPISRTRGDIEAVKQALQLPPSVTAALASRAPRSNIHDYTESPESKAAPLEDPSLEAETSTNTSELRHVKSVHRREGAFSPTPSTSTSSTTMTTSVRDDSASSQVTVTSDVAPLHRPHDDTKTTDNTKSVDDNSSGDDVPPITVIQPMQLIEEQDDQEDQDVSTDMRSSLTSIQRRRSDDLSNGSQSPPYLGHSGETPSPPPKTFRNSLTTNIKRLSSSLPRTPSLSSKSRRSSGTYYSSRTPSPSMHTIPLPPARPKIISVYPPAMFYADITARKSSQERCSLYAQKINELYMYDTGLSDWTIETKLRGTFEPFLTALCVSLTGSVANNNRPTVAISTHTFTPQPRHTSRSSTISEVSFPRRPDASLATDLTVKTQDLTPATQPVLPYPSLANQRMYPARSSSMASNTPPSSIRSLAPTTPNSKTGGSGGFFASLGRKASISSSKKPALPQLSTTSQSRVLTKNPPATAVPRTINISNSPVVPGGPRAIPNHRAARSQTLIATSNSFSSNAPSPEHGEPLGRRPSLLELSSSPEPIIVDIAPDPEFVRQVNKLVHLLPDADRDVLAGYLRRAGQDILAIGQYLEDEKNGTIKPP